MVKNVKLIKPLFKVSKNILHNLFLEFDILLYTLLSFGYPNLHFKITIS